MKNDENLILRNFWGMDVDVIVIFFANPFINDPIIIFFKFVTLLGQTLRRQVFVL